MVACRIKCSFGKNNANRTQKSLLYFDEVQLILCKNNANRMQKSLLYFVEVQLILCKDIQIFEI